MGQRHGKSKITESKLKKATSDHETLVQHTRSDIKEESNGEECKAVVESKSQEKQTTPIHVSSANDEEFLEEIDLNHTTTKGILDHKEDDGHESCDVTPILDITKGTKHTPQHTESLQSTPPTRIRSFATEDISNDSYTHDQAEISIKRQTLFSEDDVDGDISDNSPPKKQRYKRQKSTSRMRKIFSRGSSMKVAPLDMSTLSNEIIDIKTKLQRTPSYIFDIAIIAPPPELGISEMTESENRNIYGWLLDENITPVSVSDSNSHQTEAEYISVTQLYNCMSDGQKSCYLFDPSFLLLIDTREKHKYIKGHINTAYHLSDLVENESMFDPVDQYTLVVVYDDDGLSFSLTDSDLSETMDELISRKADAFVLEGGYKQFNSNFPFFCTDKIPASEAERQSLVPNYPSIILENQLYLGRVDQASNEETVRNLKITHIVCITQEITMPFKDTITYHYVQLPDEPHVSLHKCFPEAVKFIKEAIESNGIVLIHCNLGQSRSCTLVTAYLMFTKHWNLHDAYGHVKEHRPVVHPNEGFMNQLSNFERAMYGKRLTNIELYGYSVVTLKQTEGQDRRKKYKSKVKRKKDYEEISTENNESETEVEEEIKTDMIKEPVNEINSINELCICDQESKHNETSSNENLSEKSLSIQDNDVRDKIEDSETNVLLFNDTTENDDDINKQKHYMSTPFIDISKKTETHVEPKKGLKVIVVSTEACTEESNKFENNSDNEEGENVSLIGESDSENTKALKGISNVALESENNSTSDSKTKKEENLECVNELPEVTSF